MVDRSEAAINQRLKESGNRVRVRVKGNALYLRANVPAKDGKGKQRAELPLGIPATSEGLKRAEQEAHILSRRLTEGTFSWKDYGRSQDDRLQLPVSQLVPLFRDDYLTKNKVKYWDTTWGSTSSSSPDIKSIK